MNTMSPVSASVSKLAEKELFGDEPEWDIDNTIKDRRKVLMDALNWYSRFFERNDFRGEVLAFGNKAGLVGLNEVWEYVSPTYGALIRMGNRGFPLSEKELGQINTHLNSVLSNFGPSMVSEIVTPRPVVSVAPSIPEEDSATVKIREILTEFDVAEAEIMRGNILPFDVISRLKSMEVRRGIPEIIKVVRGRWEEYKGAYEGADPDLVEGYAYLGKVRQRRVVDWCAKIITDCEEYLNLRKSQRKPRTRKAVPTHSQISALQFRPEAQEEFGVKSIDPKRIIGASWVVLFNTKYRKVLVCKTNSPGGFQVKGTTIQNLDESQSFIQTLRKPQEVLNALVIAKTFAGVKVALKGITTTTLPGSGRCGKETIILNAG